MEDSLLQCGNAADYIRRKTGGAEFSVGIILGSGLGDLPKSSRTRPSSHIPTFPVFRNARPTATKAG